MCRLTYLYLLACLLAYLLIPTQLVEAFVHDVLDAVMIDDTGVYTRHQARHRETGVIVMALVLLERVIRSGVNLLRIRTWR